MKKDIYAFIVECDICQCNKAELTKPPSTLQPLPIPSSIWTNISMDFIGGLPKAGNKSVIMVVVDRLSKYAQFCALQHPVDGGKNPSQQRERLLVPQVPIRLTSVWYGRLDRIMDVYYLDFGLW